MPASGAIRVGVAGWSYDDWGGPVYPAPCPRSFDTLAYLASCVDCIEINSSFYRPPAARSAESWVRRTAHFPAFTFTVKLWRRFTHERDAAGFDAHVAEVRVGLIRWSRQENVGRCSCSFPGPSSGPERMPRG